MVHNVSLTPLGSMRPRPLGTIAYARVEKQVVNLALTKLLQRLLSKRLDSLQVRQFKRQDGHAIGRPVILQLVVGPLRVLDVSRSEDDLVRLGLLEKLLDGFQTLMLIVSDATQRSNTKLTNPEETPVATTVFAREAIVKK